VRAEAELLSTNGSTCRDMANTISGFSNGADIKVCLTYSKAISGRIADNWQLVPSNKKRSVATGSGSSDDGSKKFKTFKLLSPRIKGHEEYTALFKQVDGATAALDIKLSQSAGLRIRIGAKGLTSEDIVKFCQNFVKYEDAIDTLVPPSRRTGSAICDRLFGSNKLAVGSSASTNKQRHGAIAACANLESLINLINPEKGRNYKLYLRDLENAVHPTILFSQHSSTVNAKKIRLWTELCLAMVENSAKFRAPRALLQSRSVDEQFDALFQHVVKNEELHQFYVNRRAELSTKRKLPVANSGSRKAPFFNDRKIAAKKKSLSTTECGCCLEKFVKDEMVSCQEKGHLFCRMCIRKYVAEELYSNQSSKICCISTDGCKSAFNTRQLEHALPQKMNEKLREMQYVADMKKAGQVECNCPKCGSKGFLPKAEKTFSCPKVGCLHKSCRLCHEPGHEPLTCSEVEKQHETGARTNVEEAMSTARIKKCPYCTTQFIPEMGGGCNWVTCNNCWKNFCYVCVSKSCSGRCRRPADLTERAAVKTAGNSAVKRISHDVDEGFFDGMVEKLI